MVVFIFGNNVCFVGERLEVFVSRCEGERAHIAVVKWDGSNELSLPREQNVVVLGNARVAVIAPFLLGHGFLHPVLWRQQTDVPIWDVVRVRDGVCMDHALVILPTPSYGADLDILRARPPKSFDGTGNGSWGVNEVGNVVGDAR